MQFRLFSFALIILNCMDYSHCQGNRWRRSKRVIRCRIENCDSCFSKDFCTKCKVGFYLHRGRCFDECPDGFAPLDETMECVEKDAKLVIGVNGELVAEIIAHVDLNGVWKPEHGKLLKSQQRTRYHVQPSLNPGDVRWP
ncbi:R-spondin-2 isoform X1 [Prionailurus iriomotensis]